MKYTIQAVKEMVLKEISETKSWAMLMIESDPDDIWFYHTFLQLEKAEESLEIIFNNIIELENE